MNCKEMKTAKIYNYWKEVMLVVFEDLSLRTDIYY